VPVLLIVSQTDSGKVTRQRYSTRDQARAEVDRLLASWYARTRGRRGRAPDGLLWAPGVRGKRPPLRAEIGEVES
jgi:hypothetical protein